MNDDTANVEMLVLGGILSNDTSLNDIDLVPEQFKYSHHAKIYSYMLELKQTNQPVDMYGIDSLFKKRNNESILPDLIDFQRNAPAIKNIPVYAEKVKDCYMGRMIRDVASCILESTDRENTEVLDESIKRLMELNTTSKSFDHSMMETMKATVQEIEKATQVEGGTVGLPSGLIELDQQTGGFHKSDLVVIGARPAMGKTALLLNIMINSPKLIAGICSGEQGHKQIGSRLISMQGLINGARIRSGRIDADEWHKIQAAMKELLSRQCWINDKPGMSIEDIERQARKWVHENKVNIIGVDYIQKIRHSNSKLSTLDRITDISERLKNLAKELDIPVIALAQVNRGVDNRADKRPSMGDIKDCGVIEQEADLVMCLYRDEVYNEGQSTGVAELIIDKNRHGPLGTIYTKWEGKYMKFSDRHIAEQAVRAAS